MLGARRLTCTFMLAALLLPLVAAAPLAAQSWPTRPVKFILTLGPGSGADIGARLLADRLTRKWDQPIVIENRPGGDGIVAINAFVSAQDDHVLLFAPSSSFIGHPYQHNDLPYKIRERSDSLFRKFDLRKEWPELHTDIPRLKQGGVGAQFWSAYVPAKSGPQGKAVTQTLEQIDTIRRIVERGKKTGAFRQNIDPIDLHMSISALCFYSVSNRHTFATIFKVDMTTPKALAARKKSIIATILAAVKPVRAR